MTHDPAPTRLLAALALASCLLPLGSTSIAVALPDIGRDLGQDPALLTQLLVASYLITGIVCQSPGGKLGDLLGHRRALALGQLVSGATAIVAFLAPNVWVLAGARILGAMGGALIVPAAMAVVRIAIPEERRVRAFAVFGSVMSLSAAVGPLLGGELTAHFGWRSLFLAPLPLLVASVLLSRGLPDTSAHRSGRKVDLVGAILLGGALVLLIETLRGQRWVWAAPAATVLAAFVVWERRHPDPVVDLRLFRVPAFTAGTLVTALQNLGMYALVFELPLYFAARGVGAAENGRSLLSMMITLTVAGPIGARVAERIGARASVAAGAVVAAAGAGLLRDPGGDAMGAVPGLVGMGIGIALCSAPAQAAYMGAVAPSQSGMASGIAFTMRNLGGIVGVTVVSSLLAGGTTEARHGTAVMILTAAILASGLAAPWLPGRDARKPEHRRPA